MSKSEDKMREELARIRREEEQKNLIRELEERERKRADARAAAMDKLHQGSKTTDPQTGRESTLWDVALKEAERALNADVNAYNDWRSAMMKLWNINGYLARALHQSVKETVAAPVGNFVTDKLLMASDFVTEMFRKNPDVELPALQHAVSFTKDGHLKIEPLTRSDNHNQTSSKLDDFFAKGVRMWLEEQGYKPVAGDKSTFVNEDGKVLDKETFDNLKNDPDVGLGSFLEGHTELELRPRGP
ncbi:membrane-associated HD superfamily hydrolase [Legionella moravica]|uniref:Membrane-associated HD superfamily hydrolase n=1 Tax=Legionella moravica TaxID=39962 RepID=A0A378JXG3_9GAMM|nr:MULTISPECIES: hypothetical protein [Legionella]KTD35581.1 membrane-associated HD superfamily hydrolase [Legionella moravica]RUR16396.1 hydrolase [Legionella sp. km535]STX62730.1 membrane-associated HD superfamily hydrolase [Legionella moravica]